MIDAMRNILISLLVVAVAACSKAVSDPSVSILEDKTFSEEAGRFMVLVEGSGVWSVSTSEDWIHVQDRYYKDEAAFEIVFDSNASTVGDHRFCRMGKVYVCTWDGSRRDEVILRQEGLTPEILLKDATIGTSAGAYSMTFENNLTDRERTRLSFSSDATWITDLSYGRDGESVVFHASEGSGRIAVVLVTFTDAWGREYTSSAKVVQ